MPYFLEGGGLNYNYEKLKFWLKMTTFHFFRREGAEVKCHFSFSGEEVNHHFGNLKSWPKMATYDLLGARVTY